MKISSKWYYLNCGMSIEGAIFAAMLHWPVVLMFSLVGAVWSWYTAERLQKEEI